jgi:ABC-type nitrate/sulfonate/bicarbonate transport system ATPase subunit
MIGKETNRRIEISHISKVYRHSIDDLLVLDDVSFTVEENDFICILGESGCGKSTLFRLISGLEKPTNGDIFINKNKVSAPSSEIGLVFQNHRLMPWLTVQKNIELGFRIRKVPIPKDKIERTIELVGIDGFEKYLPKKLSGGMAQRAAIARAIVSEPNILLMDEPFGAIDAITRLRLQKELIRIWLTKKMTIVFITHDFDEAIMLATKIIILTPRPGKVRRIFQVPLNYPRNPQSNDVLRLKGVLADELTMY